MGITTLLRLLGILKSEAMPWGRAWANCRAAFLEDLLSRCEI